MKKIARLAELADALDLGSSPERGMGSTPLSRTIKNGGLKQQLILYVQ